MLRSQFEEQLSDLHHQFYEMGTEVSESIHKSVRSFIEHNRTLAQEVINYDPTINEKEIELEKRSFELIALQQPMAGDLRMIITVMKASSDLERMGDHSVSIAKATINLKGETRIPQVEEAIDYMSLKVQKMVDNVLKAYVKQDATRARKVADTDEEVNKLGARIHDQAIASMQEDPETIIAGNDYIKVSSYLERIADYVTNIAEWIVYLETGKITELSTANEEVTPENE
ncbi:MAG: phosphate signaling complex protein PhoU [Streptococcaceae bacterium]|jgi:phosphate transport system protein|nr:phosphate signaling complex protein PhoU [Streptococcaceae bacterium]